MAGIVFFPLVIAIIGSIAYLIYKTKEKPKYKVAHTSLKIIFVLFVLAIALLGLWITNFINNYSF